MFSVLPARPPTGREATIVGSESVPCSGRSHLTRIPISSMAFCGRSSTVEPQPSKLMMRFRLPSSAPHEIPGQSIPARDLAVFRLCTSNLRRGRLDGSVSGGRTPSGTHPSPSAEHRRRHGADRGEAPCSSFTPRRTGDDAAGGLIRWAGCPTVALEAMSGARTN